MGKHAEQAEQARKQNEPRERPIEILEMPDDDDSCLSIHSLSNGANYEVDDEHNSLLKLANQMGISSNSSGSCMHDSHIENLCSTIKTLGDRLSEERKTNHNLRMENLALLADIAKLKGSSNPSNANAVGQSDPTTVHSAEKLKSQWNLCVNERR